MPEAYGDSSCKRSPLIGNSPGEGREAKRARLEDILCHFRPDPVEPHSPNPQDNVTEHSNAHSNHHSSSDLKLSTPTIDDLVNDFDIPCSPTEPSSACEPFSEPSTPAAPRSPLLPRPTDPASADKFTKSRAVGQSHRDNEKMLVESLRKDVENCRDENVLLFALFSTSHRLEHCKALPYRLLGEVYCRIAHDRAEDLCFLSDSLPHGMFKLSPSSCLSLGQRFMSPTLAVVLLELMMYRRNLINITGEPSKPISNRRKRRSAYRVALSRTSAHKTIEFAINLFMREDRNDEDVYRFIDRRLGSLAVLLDTWSEWEANTNPAKVEDSDSEDEHFPPGSPTRPDAAEFGPPRRRGEGAKRCSRCNMVKFTGSGHGRSKCDDGYSISSHIPYRPVLYRSVPSSPTSESSLREPGTESSTCSN